MSARRLLAQVRAHGATLTTKGDDVLIPSHVLPDSLRAALGREFPSVWALVAAAEDAAAVDLIARASARFGWSRDDSEMALASVRLAARPALAALRWAAESGDVRSLLPKPQPTAARPARVRAKPRKEPST